MARSWLDSLRAHVEKKPIHVFRFSGEEWSALQQSKKGIVNFTIARGHESIEGIRPPSICLISAKVDEWSDDTCLCMAVVSSRRAVTTLESSLRIKDAFVLREESEADLLSLLEGTPFHAIARSRFDEGGSVVRLSPKLSDKLVLTLAESKANQIGMRRLAEMIRPRTDFSAVRNCQDDAIRTALGMFGISVDSAADVVTLDESRSTGLAAVPVIEDAVIEHDARQLPGYELIGSDQTGRAVFKGVEGDLQIITANRKELEHCLGVDLIYLNLTQESVVMLQYKMLDLEGKKDAPDWVYRPDKQLQKQLAAMRSFQGGSHRRPHEYRINPQVFYWKFVKRDASPGHGAVIVPLDHFEILMKDPACTGAKGAFRISYESLKGRYLRNNAFIDLVKSGYIGSYVEESEALKRIIDAILSDDKAVVLAIKSAVARDKARLGND